jgi:hypothetical protein
MIYGFDLRFVIGLFMVAMLFGCVDNSTPESVTVNITKPNTTYTQYNTTIVLPHDVNTSNSSKPVVILPRLPDGPEIKQITVGNTTRCVNITSMEIVPCEYR